jgi:hypothetical protein
MKKSFTKKLTLNKKTIVNLQDETMQNAKGGISAAACRTSEWIACVDTCRCPTSLWIICEYTCGCTLTECATACNSNPCC